MKTEKLDFAPILKKLSEKLNSKKFKEKIRKALNKDLKLNNDGQKLVQKMYGGKIKNDY
jgi:hypothetical protein|tara:strand:- start:197 stop:373 length:177 start_codon:yes stop_codon:yes gene_type:complete